MLLSSLAHFLFGFDSALCIHIDNIYYSKITIYTTVRIPESSSVTYRRHPLSRTFTMPNNFFGPFSNFLNVFHRLSRTFRWGFRMNHTVHFRHSNVNNCIDQCKKFRGEISGFERARKRYFKQRRHWTIWCNQNTISTWIKNKLKYFAALEQSSNKKKVLKYSDYERVDHVC